MPNTSATGGYLSPTVSPAPLEGNALVDFFHDWIAGITGMVVGNIRPRWQPEPPDLPLDGIDWMFFGITNREADVNIAEIHYAGKDQVRRQEVLTIMASFYGPNADNNAHVLREGMQVAQNREILLLNNMGFVESGDTVSMPEMIKQKWTYRVDLEFRIRRQIVREFAVLDLASAGGSLKNEKLTIPINA